MSDVRGDLLEMLFELFYTGEVSAIDDLFLFNVKCLPCGVQGGALEMIFYAFSHRRGI